MSAAVHVVVLAGGSGTRFWPAGRRSRPKQVLALAAGDERPLLAATLDRLEPLGGRAPWIVAPAEMRGVLAEAAGGREVAWLLEPAARDTAAAVALAAYAAREQDGPDAPVLVVPADHRVAPEDAYLEALGAMVARAVAGEAILTLGLTPTRAATGYGYLEVGEGVAGTKPPVHAVTRFVEKPDEERAAAMVAGGKHLWNGGTFAFRAGVFLAALERHLPAVAAALGPVFEAEGAARDDALAAAYEACPAISVDHGVMEKTEAVEVVVAELDWDDLGSWDAIGRQGTADDDGNHVTGDATLIEARDCIVQADPGSHVALVGVSDLIVVKDGDAVLVMPRGRAQAVREVVERLRDEGREDLLA